MPGVLKIVTSMASKAFLIDVARQYQDQTGQAVEIVAAGGVEVAKRIGAGEPADAVVLAAKEIDRLIDGGSVVAGSRVDLVKSPMAIAVRQGAKRYDVSSEQAVKAAVLAASSIGYSTGPSGVYLEQLLSRWGADKVKRLQAKPGVPVGVMVANGEAELGFQQLPEMINVTGLEVLGPMPPEIQLVTVFSAGIATSSTQRDAIRAAIAYFALPAALDLKRKHGLDAA